MGGRALPESGSFGRTTGAGAAEATAAGGGVGGAPPPQPASSAAVVPRRTTSDVFAGALIEWPPRVDRGTGGLGWRGAFRSEDVGHQGDLRPDRARRSVYAEQPPVRQVHD